jgi:hypothetical protein
MATCAPPLPPSAPPYRRRPARLQQGQRQRQRRQQLCVRREASEFNRKKHRPASKISNARLIAAILKDDKETRAQVNAAIRVDKIKEVEYNWFMTYGGVDVCMFLRHFVKAQLPGCYCLFFLYSCCYAGSPVCHACVSHLLVLFI